MATAEPRRQMKPDRLKVFTGKANRPLAEEICAALGCKLAGRAESEVAGPSGNREIFVLAVKAAGRGVPADPWL